MKLFNSWTYQFDIKAGDLTVCKIIMLFTYVYIFSFLIDDIIHIIQKEFFVFVYKPQFRYSMRL